MEQITSRDGTTIGYRRAGSGPPLILVHGTTADNQRWNRISSQFEQHFTVYAMDRRGRGGSGDAPDYHILREAEDVAALVEAAGAPAFLLGHSYGAICSLEAARLTGAISRLILYEPPIPTGEPISPPGAAARIQALIDQGQSEAALETFLREVAKIPPHDLEVYRRLPAWPVRVQLAPTIPRELSFDQTHRFDPARFADIQTPTLLLLGGDSPPVYRRAIQMLDSTLPNARVVILPGQQHVAMDTNPELFLGEVLGFLLA